MYTGRSVIIARATATTTTPTLTNNCVHKAAVVIILKQGIAHSEQRKLQRTTATKIAQTLTV